MNLFVEEELERSLASAGFRELPDASRAWVYSKLAVAGLRVGYAPSYASAFDALLGEQEKRRALARTMHGSFDVETHEPVSYEVDSPGSVLQAAHMLVETSKRLGRRPKPLEAVGSLFGPSNEATKRYALLHADWDSFEAQHVESYPDLVTDAREWRTFAQDWDAGSIPSSELAGRLNAEIVRANRVRATLLEHQSGQTVFVQDLPDDQKIQNISLEDADPIVNAASKIDMWASSIPVVNWITKPNQSPAGPPLKVLAIIGGAIAAVHLAGKAVEGLLRR